SSRIANRASTSAGADSGKARRSVSKFSCDIARAVSRYRGSASGLRASPQSGKYARAPWLDLLAEWQPTIATGLDDAPTVCVTTSGGVAFGQHQHVLAEGRKEALAQRAAVGSRLSIGGGTDRVPAGLAEILHARTGVADR